MRLTLYRARRRPLTNPSLLQFLSPSSSFSSPPSSTGPPDDDGGAFSDPQPPPETKPSATSFLRDVRASLKHKEEMWRPQNLAQVRSNSPPSRSPAAGPYLDIRESLREYGQRSSAPPPNPAQGQQQQQPRQQISFLKLYQRNTAAEGDRDGGVQSGFTGANTSLSFEHIRASLGALAKRPGSNNRRADSTQSWSTGSIFGKRAAREASSTRFGGGTLGGMTLQRPDRANEIGRMGITEEYAYTELGEELKKLRPGQKQGQKGWFSLKELSERLSKLRELEKKRDVGPMKEMRAGLEAVATMREKENERSSSNFRIASMIGITPDYQLTIPKEHLVEKYFHPDNMSSQEKMKLELAQVREEFKASESDCGSARVQVAQLTTKIKHLSSVLHKKDKHSRKGLQEMVQKRKKLLKYLRRTDWDSYCMVLSKLGLRDNPDYKNL
ncbi:unnamed protein product [Linum trigynum]|uniref:Small ribosomal subunit protein uS15c n=1 Tax=Linum trigynum TaxID=586398 RepID=A0AAV2FLF0_9ROSI